MNRAYGQTSFRGLALVHMAWILLVCYGTAGAVENGMLTGVVKDVSGDPTPGVEVYVYDDSNVRRPADFISPPTDGNGEFKITLPPGRYWAVARFRQGGQKYGPLLPGDKHSGSPLVFELMQGERIDEEFVIADLKETSKLTVKFNTEFIRVAGKLKTGNEGLIGDVYTFANRQPAAKKIPDYVGEWLSPDGKFVFFLPPGTYYFGWAHVFPPGSESVPKQKVTVDGETKHIDLFMN